MSVSRIVVSSDIDAALANVTAQLNPLMTRIIRPEKNDDFLLEHAEAAIKEAYIAETQEKFIVLVGASYSVVVQNKLLKILEEPPRHIIFIIITPTKNALLPTVRSRLQLEVMQEKKEHVAFDLDIKRLDLNDIYTFTKSLSRASKIEIKSLIEQIYLHAVKVGIVFSEPEMKMYHKSLVLVNLNSNKLNLVTNLLLVIYNKRHRKS